MQILVSGFRKRKLERGIGLRDLLEKQRVLETRAEDDCVRQQSRPNGGFS